MTDRPPDPPPPPPPEPAAPLEYRTPGPEPKSQWVTDEHPGSNWLVGCLLVLTAVGTVGSAVLGVAWFLAGC